MAATKPTGETPRTDAIAEGYAPECWDKTPYESMRDHARTLERQLSDRDRALKERDARIAVLEKALRELYEDQMEYIKLNHLCGAENNQVMVNARAALAAQGKP